MRFFYFLLILGSVHSLKAQLFHNRYDYGRNNFPSKHTCMTAFSENTVAIGTTLRGYTDIRHMSIDLMDASTGIPYGHQLEYRADHISTISHAIEMSFSHEDEVVAMGSYPRFDPDGRVLLSIFQTNPATGSVRWARRFGEYGFSLWGATMITESIHKTYMVLGRYQIDDGSNNWDRDMYLTRLDFTGHPIWEMRYRSDEVPLPIYSRDLIFDPDEDRIVIVGKVQIGNTNNGVVVADVSAKYGTVNSAIHIKSIDGNPSFDVKDVIRAHGHYYLAGEMYDHQRRAFIVQLDKYLKAPVPAKVYDYIRTDVSITGLVANKNELLYASFDHTINNQTPRMGLMELYPDASLRQAHLFPVDDYKSSIGIINTLGERAVLLKGSTGFADPDYGANLNLVSVEIPLDLPYDDCVRPLDLVVQDVELEIESYPMKAIEMETSDRIPMEVTKDRKLVYDCKEEIPDKDKKTATGDISVFGEDAAGSIYQTDFGGHIAVELPPSEDNDCHHAAVFDLLGRPLFHVALGNCQTTLDLSNEPSGVYLVQLRSCEGRLLKVERVVVE